LDDVEVLARLELAALEAARTLLKRYGGVPPFGLMLSADGHDLQTYAPIDDNPDADWADLSDLVVLHLRGAPSLVKAGGAALVTQLTSDDGDAVGIQVDAACGHLFLVSPFQLSPSGWDLPDPEPVDELLVPGGLR
jgi:hypothetical protein